LEPAVSIQWYEYSFFSFRENQVASVAGNLISGETVTFVTVHVGGEIMETSPKPVKHKQQSIDIKADLSIPISDTILTTRSQTFEHDEASSRLIPIIIKLNRKGLIDSELIASGKLLLPYQPNLADDDISVGLFPIEGGESEIAIARLAVQVSSHTFEKDKLHGMISELEEFIAQAATKDSKVPVGPDMVRKFLTRTQPVRNALSTLYDILTWKSYTTSWLFLVTIFFFPPYGLLVSVVVLLALSVDSDIPFTQFLSQRFSLNSETSQEDVVSLNGDFLFLLMGLSIRFSKTLRGSGFELILFAVALAWLFPLHWTIGIVMLTNTYLFSAVLALSRKFIRRMPSTEQEWPADVMIAYENQRWWMGQWSDTLLDDDVGPWTSKEGKNILAKEALTPESSYEWVGQWQTNEEEGWVYANGFSELFHAARKPDDFVRRRRWTRSFRLEVPS
jgi:hypothetical protein